VNRSLVENLQHLRKKFERKKKAALYTQLLVVFLISNYFYDFISLSFQTLANIGGMFNILKHSNKRSCIERNTEVPAEIFLCRRPVIDVREH